MHIAKPTGGGASARKYDLLTALGSHALGLGKTEQRTALRLITLVTARYNWSRDLLCVGQKEIARMWSCDERTVKREMARLRDREWLVQTRKSVRGRVAEYSLGLEKILMDTAQDRSKVGSDFVMRLEEEKPKVVQFPGTVSIRDAGTEWGRAQETLRKEKPDVFDAWLARLERVDKLDGRLRLRAPSRFHGNYVTSHLANDVLRACQAADPGIRDVVLVV